jgi:dTDP-4-amino-4,6-dideoxygalactose transaminase
MDKIQKINYLDFPEEIRLRGGLYLKAISRVLKSGVYILGNEVESFEKEFADYLGIKYCVGVANGLEAIQIALMARGIGKGDEVITTPISAVATTLAIVAVGATPVFTDVDENGQIDTTKLEKSITKKTKAIIPVDLYGQPCDLDKVKSVCKQYNLFFIEDSCQAHGSTLREKKLGTFGEVGCFSFYPTKNLGAFGDGGAIVTNNKVLADKFRQIRDYGQESKYKHTVYGLNSRLDELHSAILRVKLSFLDEDNASRRKIANRYIKHLSSLKEVQIVLPKKHEDSNFHLFVIKTKKRDELKRYLSEHGVPSLIHYPLTIPQQPVMKLLNIKPKKLGISENFVNEILSLPCHSFMKIEDVDYISKKIADFFNR